MHREAVERLAAKARGVRIDTLNDTQLKKTKSTTYHQKSLMTLFH